MRQKGPDSATTSLRNVRDSGLSGCSMLSSHTSDGSPIIRKDSGYFAKEQSNVNKEQNNINKEQYNVNKEQSNINREQKNTNREQSNINREQNNNITTTRLNEFGGQSSSSQPFERKCCSIKIVSPNSAKSKVFQSNFSSSSRRSFSPDKKSSIISPSRSYNKFVFSSKPPLSNMSSPSIMDSSRVFGSSTFYTSDNTTSENVRVSNVSSEVRDSNDNSIQLPRSSPLVRTGDNKLFNKVNKRPSMFNSETSNENFDTINNSSNIKINHLVSSSNDEFKSDEHENRVFSSQSNYRVEGYSLSSKIDDNSRLSNQFVGKSFISKNDRTRTTKQKMKNDSNENLLEYTGNSSVCKKIFKSNNKDNDKKKSNKFSKSASDLTECDDSNTKIKRRSFDNNANDTKITFTKKSGE